MCSSSAPVRKVCAAFIQRPGKEGLRGPTDSKFVAVSARSEGDARKKVSRWMGNEWTIKEVTKQ